MTWGVQQYMGLRVGDEWISSYEPITDSTGNELVLVSFDIVT